MEHPCDTNVTWSDSEEVSCRRLGTLRNIAGTCLFTSQAPTHGTTKNPYDAMS